LSYSIPVTGWRRVAIASVLLAVFATLATSGVASAAPKFGHRMLHMGAHGHDVTTLQRDLTAAGFTTDATGIFSVDTKSNVVAFQRRYGLRTDGVVGPSTYGKLTRVLHALAIQPDSGAPGPGQTATTAGSATVLPPSDSGGAGFVPTPADSPFVKATLDSTGLVDAPVDSPPAIQQVISSANEIAFKPYIFGGGHASFISAGYDCSGSVSYALHGAGLLASPLDSSQFEAYGQPGPGKWITIYTDPGHVFMDVDGIWFDTAAQSAANGNDRWSVSRISPKGGDWVVRHPAGW
jgi:cell wall-associated NlpC family hydrolase